MKMGMKNALCCFLLLVLVFGACFHLPFVAFCCSSLLFLVFEIESILSQKPKQANAFYCSLWLFVARFGFLWMFPFEHRIARCGFLLVRKTKTSNERQKMSKWKPGFTQMNSSQRYKRKGYRQNFANYIAKLHPLVIVPVRSTKDAISSSTPVTLHLPKKSSSRILTLLTYKDSFQSYSGVLPNEMLRVLCRPSLSRHCSFPLYKVEFSLCNKDHRNHGNQKDHRD